MPLCQLGMWRLMLTSALFAATLGCQTIPASFHFPNATHITVHSALPGIISVVVARDLENQIDVLIERTLPVDSDLDTIGIDVVSNATGHTIFVNDNYEESCAASIVPFLLPVLAACLTLEEYISPLLAVALLPPAQAYEEACSAAHITLSVPPSYAGALTLEAPFGSLQCPSDCSGRGACGRSGCTCNTKTFGVACEFGPPDAPEAFVAEDITPSSVTLSWNPGHSAVHRAQFYSIFWYRAAGVTSPRALRNETALGNATVSYLAQQFTVNGLTSASTFYILIESGNSHGISNVTGPVNATTPPVIALPPAPRVADASPTSLTMEVPAVPLAVLATLTVRVEEEDGRGLTALLHVASFMFNASTRDFSMPFNVTVPNLTSGITYFTSVSAKDSFGTRVTSNVTEGTTVVPPVVVRVVPAGGLATGNQTVHIVGEHFANTSSAAVMFGGVVAASTWINANLLSAVTPPLPDDTGKLVVAVSDSSGRYTSEPADSGSFYVSSVPTRLKLGTSVSEEITIDNDDQPLFDARLPTLEVVDASGAVSATGRYITRIVVEPPPHFVTGDVAASDSGIVVFPSFTFRGVRGAAYDLYILSEPPLVAASLAVTVRACGIIEPNTVVANNSIDCVCRPGFVHVQGSCSPCPPDTFKSEAGNGACKRCPPDRSTNGRVGSILDACTCRSGLFARKSDPKCYPCPEGGLCKEGTNELVPLEGYWSSADLPEELILCSLSDCRDAEKCQCLGGRPRACGPRYEGLVCASCSPGYGRASGGECAPCGSGFLPHVVVMVAALLVFAVAVGAMTYTALRPTEVNGVVAGGKIALASAQVLGLLGGYAVRWPRSVHATLSLMSYSNAGYSSLKGPGLTVDCSANGVVFEFGMASIAVFVIPVCTLVGSCIATVAGKDKFQRVFPVSTIVAYSLAHAGITAASLEMFACRTINGISVYEGDLSVQCAGGESRFLILVMAVFVLVVFSLGFPVLAIGILPSMDTLESNPLAFLTMGYEDRYTFWEVVVIFRKMCFVVVKIWLRRSPFMQMYIALIVLVVSEFLQTRAQPYRLQAFLAALLVVVFAGVLLRVEDLSDVAAGLVSVVSVLCVAAAFALYVGTCLLSKIIARVSKDSVKSDVIFVEPDNAKSARTDGVALDAAQEPNASHADGVALASVHSEAGNDNDSIALASVHSEPGNDNDSIALAPAHSEAGHADSIALAPAHSEAGHADSIALAPAHSDPAHSEAGHADSIALAPAHSEAGNDGTQSIALPSPPTSPQSERPPETEAPSAGRADMDRQL